MVYAPSGAIVAAPTAGLPEAIGGKRNWDYRYCWLRDATLTLDSLMVAGFRDEAAAFRRWLYQTIAGAPEDLQIMYGVLGERRLQEFEVPWLVGYDESRPVRIGNAASGQFQLDVYGEVVQAMYEARRLGVPEGRFERGPELELLRFLEGAWQRPDQGIWEMRGHAQHFVHSKVMAWAAFDRAARLYEEFSQPSDPVRSHVPRFRALAERIRREVCEQGFDGRRNAFVQAYGSRALDASSLLIPALGFLPARDPRVLGTIEAIERELVRDGLVLRYRTDGTSPARPEHRRSQDKTDDGLPGSEGAFLACSFWLADAYAYAGRRKEAEALFERLLGLRSEVGLLSEEYDPEAERLVGNYPQALSHLALVHTASLLADAEQTPRARERSERAAALHTATSHPSEHRH
jgi:GH15 family glucan-1,4-alpha-glucosidase